MEVLRTVVLYISFAAIILYGYALAGLGGYYVGRGRIDYIVWGLSLGTVCALVALWLWSRYRKNFYVSAEQNQPKKQ